MPLNQLCDIVLNIVNITYYTIKHNSVSGYSKLVQLKYTICNPTSFQIPTVCIHLRTNSYFGAHLKMLDLIVFLIFKIPWHSPLKMRLQSFIFFCTFSELKAIVQYLGTPAIEGVLSWKDLMEIGEKEEETELVICCPWILIVKLGSEYQVVIF